MLPRIQTLSCQHMSKRMELFIIVGLVTACFSHPISKARMPLLGNLRASLFAELDTSQVNEQLKEYIDDNVEIQINDTLHEIIEDMINKRDTEIKATYGTLSALVQEIKSQFSELELSLKRKYEDIENQQKQKFDELYRNITNEQEDTIGTTVTVTTKPVSGKGWTKHNGHCYYYGVDEVKWITAEGRCKELGGYLLKVDNDVENKWVFANRKKNNTNIWIGLSDLRHDTFRWTMDATEVSFRNFYTGHGSKRIYKTCVVYGNGLLPEWMNVWCGRKYYFICEANQCL